MSVLLVYNANKPIRNSVRHVSIMDAVPSYISSILTVAKMSQACKHESSAYAFTRCKLNQKQKSTLLILFLRNWADLHICKEKGTDKKSFMGKHIII